MSYLSTCIYVLIAVFLIAFILNVFHIIAIKQKLDHTVDQMVKQIQLSGGTTSDTERLFSYLTNDLNGVSGLNYKVEASASTDKVQLGTPFYVTITGNTTLGGMCRIKALEIPVKAKGAGVSEVYWK